MLLMVTTLTFDPRKQSGIGWRRPTSDLLAAACPLILPMLVVNFKTFSDFTPVVFRDVSRTSKFCTLHRDSSHSEWDSGSAWSWVRASSLTAPQSSRTHRSNPARVVQKDRSCQPEFRFRGLPFLRCSTHWRGSLTTLQFVFSCAMNRFEGCAGREA